MRPMKLPLLAERPLLFGCWSSPFCPIQGATMMVSLLREDGIVSMCRYIVWEVHEEMLFVGPVTAVTFEQLLMLRTSRIEEA
jgi:hypothetical protein